ncbi:MAG: hypothetical protein AB9882_12740 [Ignavibacteriaceae bacterium]
MSDIKNIDDLMLEREKLRYELITLQNEIDFLKNASEKASADFQNVKGDFSQTVSSLSGNIENLKTVKDDLLREIAESQTKYEKTIAEISEQEKKWSELKYQIEESVDLLGRKNYSREELLAEINLLENNLKGLKFETANISNFEQKLASSEEKLKWIKEDLGSFVKDVLRQVDDRDKAIELKKSLYESLQRDVNQMEINRDSLLSDLSNTGKELESTKYLLKESEEELFANNEKKEKLLLMIENLETKKRQYERFIDSIPDETREMLENQELSETKLEIEELHREAAAIKEKTEAIKSEQSELIKERDSLYYAISELKSEIGQKENEKAVLHYTLENLNVEIRNLTEKQELMEKMQRKQEAETSLKNDEIVRMQEEIEQYKKEIKEKDVLIESFLNKDDDELA